MYTAEISRANPTAYLYVVDQSGSMAEAWGGGGMSKAQKVADAINKLLSTQVIRCSKGEPVYDYFHVGVFGYGASVGPCLGGSLAGQQLIPISQLATSPARLDTRTQKQEDGAGGLVDTTVRFPIWLDPIASGGTPMCEALRLVQGVVSQWVAEHPTGYPPTVIHITDGESTDGNPSSIAEEVRRNVTQDGTTLLFNIHISSKDGEPQTFPSSDSSLPDDAARLLFHMSSVLPESTRREAAKGFPVSDNSRGFFFNADAVKLIQFLDIGTRAANLR